MRQNRSGRHGAGQDADCLAGMDALRASRGELAVGATHHSAGLGCRELQRLGGGDAQPGARRHRQQWGGMMR